jgi:paxillin
MGDLEAILNEISLDPKYDGELDFDDDLNGLMADLEDQDRSRGYSKSHQHQHKPPPAKNTKQQNPSHFQQAHAQSQPNKLQQPHHHPQHPSNRSTTQANLDELESLVAELTSSGDVLEQHDDYDNQSYYDGHNAHQSVMLGDQPTFDSSLDALLVDLGGIGEQEPVQHNHNHNHNSGHSGQHKRSSPPPAHNHKPNLESDEFEGLLSDLTGGTTAPPSNRPKTHSIANKPSSSNLNQSHGRSGPPATNKNANVHNSDPYDDDLDSLMGELTGIPVRPSAQPATQRPGPAGSNAGRTNSPSISAGTRPQPANNQNRGGVQRGASQTGLSTHQEAEDLDSLMNELTLNATPVTRPAAASTAKHPAQKPPQGVKSSQQAVPLQRQATNQQVNSAQKGAPNRHNYAEDNADDLDKLMEDLVPSVNTRGRQSVLPGHPQYNQPVTVNEVAELDDLMADLSHNVNPMAKRTNTHTHNFSQQPSQRNVRETLSPEMNNDLDDMINNLQTGYGMVEAPAGRSGYSVAGNNVQNPVPRTVTNQNKPVVRVGPSTRDLSALMEDLNSPVDNFSNQQQVTRKPPEPKLAKGMCAGCRKYISSTQKIQAMGREYHPEHFQCSTCNKVIGNGNFFEKEGQPQCQACFQAVFCSKCAGCGQPITTHCVTALGQSWHPECFVCGKCRSPFNNASFFEKMGKPYCSVCIYDLHAQKCRSCNQPIRGSVINALGASWHPEHFNCQSCNQPFPGGAFYEVNGLPYCDIHYNQLIR